MFLNEKEKTTRIKSIIRTYYVFAHNNIRFPTITYSHPAFTQYALLFTSTTIIMVGKVK